MASYLRHINANNVFLGLELILQLPPYHVGRFDRAINRLERSIGLFFETMSEPAFPGQPITNFEASCQIGFWAWVVATGRYNRLFSADFITSMTLDKIMKKAPEYNLQAQPIKCSVPGIWSVSLSAIDELHINGNEGLDVDKGQLVAVPEWKEGGLDRVARLVENQIAVQGVEKAFSNISKAGLSVLRRHLIDHREEWDRASKLDGTIASYLQNKKEI